MVERGREQWPFTLIGYFDDFRRAAAAVIRELPIREAAGWYFTLNPCDPAVHGRAYNRLRVAGKNDGVKDREIFRRGWLPLDFDPVRPTGVSSTDAEHEEALALAIVVRSNSPHVDGRIQWRPIRAMERICYIRSTCRTTNPLQKTCGERSKGSGRSSTQQR
ncbi:MAG: hypothetical protein IPF82_11665 [Blastocatellia bacterium]|nr:hypothetical protein [Blastocatellia bacterium]